MLYLTAKNNHTRYNFRTKLGALGFEKYFHSLRTTWGQCDLKTGR